jgi:glycine/D-amino acid oxidase-like deaminating enzyme
MAGTFEVTKHSDLRVHRKSQFLYRRKQSALKRSKFKMALTLQRDLRTGTPVWLSKGLPKFQSAKLLPGKIYDVVIVGSGISGALVADALQSAGMSVLVVDRRKPMSGSTPASTALLQSELDTPLTALERKLGKSDAARVWLRSAQAVQSLSDRIEDLHIDCDFRARSTLYLPGDVLDNAGLKKESKARQKLGLRSNYLGRTSLLELSGLQKSGAIHTKGNAEANPVKLVAGLWRNFLRRGGQMRANTEIIAFDQTRTVVRLETEEGQRVHAKHAVFCTGYELLKGVQPKGYKIISTWVLATKPQSKQLWKGQSLIWEAAYPYLYLRTTADGRIIVGGEDEAFSDVIKCDAMIPKKILAIARKAKRLVPQADFEADFSWAGCFGESPTGLPAVGPIRGFSRCYAVLGFGGNGITFSMLAAQLVSRHMQGLKDPDAELFAI